MQRHVIGGGGGRSEAGGYVLQGTIGQAIAGKTSQGTYDLCSGFWCGGATSTQSIYLPLTLNNW
jgi:hypothetical protein